VEIPRQEERAVKAVCLLLHDVVEDGDWDSSGFTGPGTAKYKLSVSAFEAHLAAIDAARAAGPIAAAELASYSDGTLPFLLTFDDGGESAATRIADLLGERGWRGHFFVTAGQIGKKGFLNAEQIRGLKQRGHIIGSHSFSHPTRMSHCTDQELRHEWGASTKLLSDILGEQIDMASVPGGYYSRRVAEAASAAGIRVLFNSEPTTVIHTVQGCLVVGRYNIMRGTPSRISADLVSRGSGPRTRQWLYWNLKKIGKVAAGRPYLAARQWLLRKG
jgi:peptidoglycan/xylan/chitin deacetylase (PgdA/CDA1 family)